MIFFNVWRWTYSSTHPCERRNKRVWEERRRPIYDSCLTDSYPHQSYSLHASLRYAFRSVALMWSQSIFERCSQMSCGLHWYSLFDSKKWVCVIIALKSSKLTIIFEKFFLFLISTSRYTVILSWQRLSIPPYTEFSS